MSSILKRMLARLLKNELKNELRDELRDELMNERRLDSHQTEKRKEQLELISKNLPVAKGDVITFVSGRKYKVIHSVLHGDYRVNNYRLMWINKPDILFEKENTVVFDTLRELNFHLKEQIHEIQSIYRTEFRKNQKELSIDECHKLAFKEDKARVRLKNFLKELKAN